MFLYNSRMGGQHWDIMYFFFFKSWHSGTTLKGYCLWKKCVFLYCSMLKSIPNGMWVKSLEYKLWGVFFSLFFFLDSAKAQSVEEELIGSHREEASQLRKVISQKEDELHKTVQKYEQVIQVLWKIICFFYGFYDGKGIRTNAAASPSLTQDTTHQLLMFWIICHVRTFFLFFY